MKAGTPDDDNESVSRLCQYHVVILPDLISNVSLCVRLCQTMTEGNNKVFDETKWILYYDYSLQSTECPFTIWSPAYFFW